MPKKSVFARAFGVFTFCRVQAQCPAPKETYTDLFLDLQGFSGILRPKPVLSDALVRTVST